MKSSIERPPDPQNALPFARGNSRELEEAEMAPPSRGTAPETSVARGTPKATAEGQMAANEPRGRCCSCPNAPTGATGCGGSERRGARREAWECAAKSRSATSQQQSFDNDRAAATREGLIQFDSKGVDFGPWLRRFVAQVKRNWFVPQAAMIMKGHVVITFNIHRNGAITDIEVKKPSHIESFNTPRSTR